MTTTTSTSSARRRRVAAAVAVTFGLVAAACGGDDDAAPVTADVPGTDDAPDDDAPDDETPDDTADDETPDDTPDDETPDDTPDEEAPDDDGADGELISAERCAANEAAGTITWVSGFDFAAAAGQLEVIAAQAQGYFEDYCLDVELQPGFAPANSSIVAAGTGQIGIAGDIGDVIEPNLEGADLVAIAQWGHTAVEGLAVSGDSGITSLADVAGSLVGVKGDIPSPVLAMLALNGVERSDFDEILLDGFDPIAHFELGIDAVPVYKSNEPNQLDAAGFEFTLFDPLDFDVPSSYAVVFANGGFARDHPTAVEDFMRASARGFEFAVADPDAALDAAFELIDAAGNQLFLAREAEAFRWTTEAALVVDTSPGPLGVIVPSATAEELALLVDLGLMNEVADYESMLLTDVMESLYDGDGQLVIQAG